MSEFEKLTGDAEQYAKDHPRDVHQAEQDAEHIMEKKVGANEQRDEARPDRAASRTRTQVTAAMTPASRTLVSKV